MASRFAFRKAAWFIPAFFLNILFLGTSRVLSYLPSPYWPMYVYITAKLSLLFQGDIQAFYDYSSLVLTILLVVLVYLGYHDQGFKRAFLSVLQICSVSFFPLGIEILIFDYAEWNLHVTKFQADYNIIPWFSNAYLFFSSMTLFFGATLLKWYLLRSKTCEEIHSGTGMYSRKEI